MRVSEQSTLVGLPERRPGCELGDSAEVVQQGGGQQEVGTEPRVQLRRLAADRRDADGVLEEPAGVRVVRLCGRKPAERSPQELVCEEPSDDLGQSLVCDLPGEELQEAVQLVGVSPERRCERGRVGVRRGLERPDVDLQAVPELLDAAEHPHRVALGEAPVQQFDVVPDACVDAAAWIDELQRQIGRAALRPQPLLPCDRVDAFDDPLLGQLGDRAHEASLGPQTDARVGPMAEVKPFRAERYDEAKAGPLEELVAPPYDVISLRVEPYETGAVLPHERTHSGPKEGRLRLLRATRTQLEPIFLLYEEEALEQPSRAPDLQSGGDKLWRIGSAPDFADTQLLIADGHHRYETALAYAEEGGSPFLMVVLVPTGQEGLTIFPTHRVAQRLNGVSGTPIDEPDEELPGVVVYRGGRYELVPGEGLDVEIVDRIAPEGVTYTPRRDEAVATVDRGDAEAAFLLRPTRIEDVWAIARRGETMPQKSTYFYPKLTSGLLFHPLD